MLPRTHLLTGWIFLIGLVCLTGCRTTDEAHTGNMASVEISGYTKSQIQDAAAEVFKAHGYTKTEDLTFEKPGSAWETANYGGWSSNPVWVRIRCELVSTESRQYTLGCDAFVVEDHGEVGTETERKFWFAKRGECKDILDEIKAELKKTPVSDQPVAQ